MFRFFKSGSKPASSDGPSDAALLDGRTLGRVLQHFPVGGKVQQGSPDEVKRNPGPLFPDSTSFHPGYSRVG